MSRSNPERIKLKELTTGLHLVVITDAGIIKKDGVPVQSSAGETGIFVRFTTNENKSFDHDFWIGGEKEHFFNFMCGICQIDRSLPFKKESIGKRLWIGIKEVWDINGDNLVYQDEKPVVNYYLFDVFPFSDKKPTMKGDPSLNSKNQASGSFLDYRQVEGKSFVEKVIRKDYENKGIDIEKAQEEIRANTNKEEFVPEVQKAPVIWENLSDTEKKVIDKNRFISEKQDEINIAQTTIPSSPFDTEFGPPAKQVPEKKKPVDPEIDTFSFPKSDKDPFNLPVVEKNNAPKGDANSPVDWTNF